MARGWHGRRERRCSDLLVTAPQLDRRVRPISVSHCSWARARRARGSGWGDSNSTALISPVRGQGTVGRATCGSCERLVSARARCCPWFALLLRTQHGPEARTGIGAVLASGAGWRPVSGISRSRSRPRWSAVRAAGAGELHDLPCPFEQKPPYLTGHDPSVTSALFV